MRNNMIMLISGAILLQITLLVNIIIRELANGLSSINPVPWYAYIVPSLLIMISLIRILKVTDI